MLMTQKYYLLLNKQKTEVKITAWYFSEQMHLSTSIFIDFIMRF